MRISDWSSDVCSSDLHNLTYWRYGDYLGVGPGAHGRRGGCATFRRRKPENWLAALTRNGHGIESEEPLAPRTRATEARSEEHTSELQSLMRISYAVFCLKKKKQQINTQRQHVNNDYKTSINNKN